MENHSRLMRFLAIIIFHKNMRAVIKHFFPGINTLNTETNAQGFALYEL